MARKKETRGGWNKKYTTEHQRKKAQIISNTKWSKANTKIVNVRFNVENDKLVLDKLSSVNNKADYIRQLILADIKG